MSAGSPSAAELETRLAAIESHEATLRNCSWRYFTTQHTLDDPDDVESIVGTSAEYRSGSVLVEYGSACFKLEIERVAPWRGGLTPWLGTSAQYAFDGSAYRTAARRHLGQALPHGDDPPGFGRVQPLPDNQLAIHSFETGHTFLPPFVLSRTPGAQRLSHVLRSKLGKGLVIRASHEYPDEWNIHYPDGDDQVHIRYSLALGGVVRELTLADGDPQRVWRRVRIEYAASRDGHSLPRRIDVVGALERPPTLDRIELSDVRVNQDLTDEDFRFAFPLGMLVDDELRARSEFVGCGPADDSGAALRFRQRNR